MWAGDLRLARELDHPGVPGASTRDPTHDKVMRRTPDKQGKSGLQGFRKAAPASP